MEHDRPKRQQRKDDAPNPPSSSTDFSHPVFKRLSQINGAINKLHKDELQDKLNALGLNRSGTKEVLRKRLKSYYKNKKLGQSQIVTTKEIKYDYLLVIDFEATCDSSDSNNYKHEIIEFPIVVVDCNSKSVIDHYHSYVKPVVNPSLTSFCSELTGITQETVDQAPTFPAVLQDVCSWLKLRNYYKRSVVLTDGPWDMSRFMYLSCQLHDIAFPYWARKWINIRKAFSNFYNCKRMNLKQMLETSGFTFEGQPHCGLDDARNIARLVIRLLEDGCTLTINERLFSGKLSENLKSLQNPGNVGTISKQQEEVVDSVDVEEESDDNDEDTMLTSECGT